MDNLEVMVILTGTALVMIALFVELEHKVIWKNYKKHYHPHKNELVDKLLRPNRTVYALNIYVVWPLVLVLGLYIILRPGI